VGIITLVRHGQACIDSDDYDRLSELGRSQSRLLGDWFSEHNHRFDRVLVGPLRRHEQTLQEMLQGAGEGACNWPEAQRHEALTEHQAIAMLEHVIGAGRRVSNLEPNSDPEQRRENMKQWFVTFDRTMRQWIRGEVEAAHLENWQQARARVAVCLDEIVAEAGPDEQILIITSGGFLSMALGQVWGLDDETTYELGLEVNNSSWAEIRFSDVGHRVRCFNWHPHIRDPELLTLV
jgi:broad specificity phosphatase PhoE